MALSVFRSRSKFSHAEISSATIIATVASTGWKFLESRETFSQLVRRPKKIGMQLGTKHWP